MQLFYQGTNEGFMGREKENGLLDENQAKKKTEF